MRWPLDQAAIRREYESSGFVVLKSLFSPDQLDEIVARLQRYILNIVPHLPAMDVFYQDKQTNREIRMLSRMESHDEFFRQLLGTGPLLEMAEYIWRCPAMPHDVAYFNKPVIVGEGTPPHQDGYYFHLEPCEALTMWMALDHVDQHNGCVRYVSQSHRRGMRPHGRTNVLGFSQGILDYGTEADLRNEVPVCVAPGDVIVHDAMTIHRADPNRSTRPRRAVGFVYFSSRASVDKAARDRYQQQLSGDLAREGKI
jgi:phytanoyl-CoA hydroxylase